MMHHLFWEIRSRTFNESRSQYQDKKIITFLDEPKFDNISHVPDTICSGSLRIFKKKTLIFSWS